MAFTMNVLTATFALLVFACAAVMDGSSTNTTRTCDGLASYQLDLKTLWSKSSFPNQYPAYRPTAQWTRLIDEEGSVVKRPTSLHIHDEPGPARAAMMNVRHNVLEECQRRPEASPAALLNEFVTPDVATQLPSERSLKRAIQRKRKHTMPVDPITANNIVVADPWRVTLDGQAWYLGDVQLNDDSGYIFTTENNLSKLQDCVLWLADGTFSAAPHQFLQLFTIHGFYRGRVFPFVVMFTTRRTQSMYNALLSKLVQLSSERFMINLSAKFLSTDFELAAINAFQEVFPGVVVNGCHFHLCQAVIRKVADMGHKRTYQDDEQFAIHVRMLMALAFLPTDSVKDGFALIQSTAPVSAAQVVEYFNSTYVNGPVIRGSGVTAVRRPPMFPPTLWNVAERFRNLMPTTNNHVEAWHRRLQSLIVTDHPAFYNCLHKLRQEQRHTELELLRMELGYRQPRRRRSIDENEKRISTLTQDLTDGRKDISTFLRSVAYTFSKYNVPTAVTDSIDANAAGDVANVAVVATPNRRRCLRDLPSRRAAASTTAATTTTARSVRPRTEIRSRAPATIARPIPVRPDAIRPDAVPEVPALPASAGAVSASPANESAPETTISAECPVCKCGRSDTAIIPCGHCACSSCINVLFGAPSTRGISKTCPVCRSNIRDIMRLHF